MANKIDLLADTSFYSCFLDCIKDEKPLLKIVEYFRANLSPKISEELNRSPNISLLDGKIHLFHKFTNIGLDLSAAAKPFFSEPERDQGEAEILVLAYICYNMGMDILVIIDEISKKDLLLRCIPELKGKASGTLGFIGDCVDHYNIFNKEEALNLLELIRPSHFKIKKVIIDEVEKRIKSLR